MAKPDGATEFCRSRWRRRLAYVALTFVYGLRAHSLALLSESGHNVSDLLAMALSFVALYFPAAAGDRGEDVRVSGGPGCWRRL